MYEIQCIFTYDKNKEQDMASFEITIDETTTDKSFLKEIFESMFDDDVDGLLKLVKISCCIYDFNNSENEWYKSYLEKNGKYLCDKKTRKIKRQFINSLVCT